MSRGWFLTETPEARAAHYFASGVAACSVTLAPIEEWRLHMHLGAVALCEACKDEIRGGPWEQAPDDGADMLASTDGFVFAGDEP